MCLYRIIGKPEKTSGIGYKVYQMDYRNDLRTSYYSLNGKDTEQDFVDFNKQYKSIKNKVVARDGKVYRSGFHIFLSIASATKWIDSPHEVIVKVRYKKARLKGTQNFFNRRKLPCIVADEITLLEIVK